MSPVKKKKKHCRKHPKGVWNGKNPFYCKKCKKHTYDWMEDWELYKKCKFNKCSGTGRVHVSYGAMNMSRKAQDRVRNKLERYVITLFKKQRLVCEKSVADFFNKAQKELGLDIQTIT